MSTASVAQRFWRSFSGGGSARPSPAAGRGRAGYSLRQRIWASFIGVDLPPARSGAAAARPAPAARSTPRQAGRLESGWFALPPLPALGGLTAAGGDTVLVEADSPDGRARFLVRAQGEDRPEYSLELVLRGGEAEVERPLVSAVRYTRSDGGARHQQLLLVPVVQGRFGPGASYVRLPGFAADAEWSASPPAPVAPGAEWDGATVAASVRAALNEATRDAWRQVRERVGDDLRRVIDGELP